MRWVIIAGGVVAGIGSMMGAVILVAAFVFTADAITSNVSFRERVNEFTDARSKVLTIQSNSVKITNKPFPQYGYCELRIKETDKYIYLRMVTCFKGNGYFAQYRFDDDEAIEGQWMSHGETNEPREYGDGSDEDKVNDFIRRVFTADELIWKPVQWEGYTETVRFDLRHAHEYRDKFDFDKLIEFEKR